MAAPTDFIVFVVLSEGAHCAPLHSKFIMISLSGTPGDSPQCGEMSRSDKGAGHVSSAASPTKTFSENSRIVGADALVRPIIPH